MSILELLQQKIDNKTKPVGALGEIETTALKIGEIQQTLTPSINNPTIIVFAADHGLSEEKISPYPKDVTWQMVMNFVSGGAAINVFCKQNNIDLLVVDAGVDYEFSEDLPIIHEKIKNGTNNMLHQPAMSKNECSEAIEKGKELVALIAEQGCNTIGFGEMGIGNTSSSALLMYYFTQIPLDKCVGAGAGMTGDNLKHKLSVLNQVAEKYTPEDPIEALSIFGGLEIAMMAGAYIEAAKRNMLILVDGFISTAALLTAENIEKGVKNNCVFCHCSDEKGHALLLEHLQAKPLLNLGLRLGEGTGAALAFPLIQASVNFLNDMASFEDAGVDKKS